MVQLGIVHWVNVNRMPIKQCNAISRRKIYANGNRTVVHSNGSVVMVGCLSNDSTMDRSMITQLDEKFTIILFASNPGNQHYDLLCVFCVVSFLDW